MCPYGPRALFPWEGVPLEYSKSHRVPEVPSESTATALLPHRTAPLDAPDMRPRHAACSEQSRPIRRTSTGLARAVGSRWYAQVIKIGECGERARHTPRQRVVPEVAAHPKRTRPLGTVLRRTHSNHVPLRSPRTVPIGWGAPGVLRSHIACPRSPLRAPQQPCCRTAPPRSMPPTCSPRHAARSEQSRPIRPSSAARANAIGKKGACTVLQDW
jgi:hypothetical protein